MLSFIPHFILILHVSISVSHISNNSFGSLFCRYLSPTFSAVRCSFVLLSLSRHDSVVDTLVLCFACWPFSSAVPPLTRRIPLTFFIIMSIVIIRHSGLYVCALVKVIQVNRIVVGGLPVRPTNVVIILLVNSRPNSFSLSLSPFHALLPLSHRRILDSRLTLVIFYESFDFS